MAPSDLVEILDEETPAKRPQTKSVPLSKRIPKIALNFTKWRLQQQMVTDLRDITDPQETQKRLLKYTQCFDLLDKLGADNCIDPEDFSQEDIDDELFKNLEISDIWELFNEEQEEERAPVPQSSAFEYASLDDQDMAESPQIIKSKTDISGPSGPTDEDQLLLDQDSDLRDEEDLQFMDIDEQMKIYDKMDASHEEAPNKFKSHGLEEVTEMTEESESSDLSYDDMGSSSSDSSSHETVDRVKMAEDILLYEQMASQFF
jgi:hypothetical protein